MSERADRINELRKARGLKPIVETIIEIVDEEDPKKKKTKKKEIIVETNEEINTDNLFETDPEPLNKEEEKVEEKPEEELLNE